MIITDATGSSPILSVQKLGTRATGRSSDAVLMQTAKDLEASFLSEMLRHAGLGRARESFGGGIGEDQFSSFLRDIHARELAGSGGLGLAENLFRALKRQQDA